MARVSSCSSTMKECRVRTLEILNAVGSAPVRVIGAMGATRAGKALRGAATYLNESMSLMMVCSQLPSGSLSVG
jgi:hypothetical protein